MNIALIGPRGVGKSKISRKMSKMTGLPVISTDMIAVYESGGISIEEMIRRNHGNWKNFRELEYRILKNISNAKNIILDCGGGIIFDIDAKGNEILSERKVKLLKSFATIIYLSQGKDYLLNKVQSDPNRPDLSAINSYEMILNRRIPLYENTADIIYKIETSKPDVAAKDIFEKLKR